MDAGAGRAERGKDKVQEALTVFSSYGTKHETYHGLLLAERLYMPSFDAVTTKTDVAMAKAGRSFPHSRISIAQAVQLPTV